MADKKSQKSTKFSLEIKLNEVFLGKRRLRYIYLYQPNIVSTKLDKYKQCMPLFLGSDVLDECSISSGNLPRFHARHAKRSLATKMNFQPGVRVVGIHGTTHGVWFYSVQGLFKIAFEYFTRDEQWHCLRKLREVWQRQIYDPVLTSEINVVFKNGIEETELGLSLEPAEEGIDRSIVPAGVDQLIYHVNKVIDGFVCENNESLQHEIGLLKTYLSHMHCNESSDSFLDKTVNLVKTCLKLIPTISEKLESSGGLPLSDTHSNGTRYDNLTSSIGLSTASHNKHYVDNQNIACKKLSDSEHFSSKEAVILEIAKWLGKEFLNYHADVSEKVTSFKQKNMSSIGNLPSAENLVDEVFPKSMQALLCSWLQVPLADSESDTGGSDNRLNLYPVIQLILELANQSLVSGVAHVLFSQLVQSDSVQ